MKIVFVPILLALGFAPRACDAQQARGQVTASVTIVEAIGVTAGATAVTQANGETLDVTTPLSIRGSAPRVVQVVDGERARPVSNQLRSTCSQEPAESCDVRARIPAPAQADPTILTYLVATVN